MVRMYKELINTVAPVSANAKKESVIANARDVLCDGTINKNECQEKALSMLAKEMVKRGGKLESAGPEGAKKITCTLSIPAGQASSSKLVKVGDNGQINTMRVTELNSLDERIVEAAIGFGMGILDVSFNVKGDECSYIIKTNGSRHCLEENKLNVAIALAGASAIVEEMLEAKKIDEAIGSPKLIGLKKAA